MTNKNLTIEQIAKYNLEHGTYFKSGGIIPYLYDNNMLVFKDNKLYLRKKPKYYKTLPPLNLEPIKELEQLGKT